MSINFSIPPLVFLGLLVAFASSLVLLFLGMVSPKMGRWWASMSFTTKKRITFFWTILFFVTAAVAIYYVLLAPFPLRYVFAPLLELQDQTN